MRSKYIVRKSQNLYDIAVQIYGSIEGLFDLLISNDGLSMDSTPTEGTELSYHTEYIQKQTVVDALDDIGVTVANGNGKSYTPVDSTKIKFIYYFSVEGVYERTLKLGFKGSGSLMVDWGDGTEDKITLTSNVSYKSHSYSSDVYYNLRVYGDGSITNLYIGKSEGTLYKMLNFSHTKE